MGGGETAEGGRRKDVRRWYLGGPSPTGLFHIKLWFQLHHMPFRILRLDAVIAVMSTNVELARQGRDSDRGSFLLHA